MRLMSSSWANEKSLNNYSHKHFKNLSGATDFNKVYGAVKLYVPLVLYYLMKIHRHCHSYITVTLHVC